MILILKRNVNLMGSGSGKLIIPKQSNPNPKYREHDFPSSKKRLKDSWERGKFYSVK